MIDSDDTIDRIDACASCGDALGAARYLQADAPDLRSYCSERCLRAAQSAQRKQRWKARRRAMKVLTIGLAVAGACLVPHQGPPGLRPPMVTTSRDATLAAGGGATATP